MCFETKKGGTAVSVFLLRKNEKEEKGKRCQSGLHVC